MIINDVRALAYTTTIDWVRPIAGADNIELVGIGGWTCIAKIGEFKQGDICVYFEIDSKLPEDKEWCAFLASKKFKVKTMKLSKFGVVSQGLALPLSAFDIDIKPEIGQDLTATLGVVYSDAEDNQRKGKGPDKYAKMAQRRPNIFKKRWARWLMKREWGRRLMFFLFGRKKDKRGWPAWVKKTDEERIECMSWLFPSCDIEWVGTEKIDGTSTTFTMRGYGKKREFYVCSRNVVFDKPDKKCFYDTNVYTLMAEKYNIESIMDRIMSQYGDLDHLTIQGETYGNTIQKRDYGVKDEYKFAAFNIIYGWKDGRVERLNPIQMTELCEYYSIPAVPVLFTGYKLPATCAEVKEITGGPSMIDGGMREGIVFRSMDGVHSFKSVDAEFLMKYHG